MRTRWIGTLAACGLLVAVRGASAATLGIALDDFLVTFEAFMVGLGIIVGLAGLFGWAMAHMSNAFGQLLSGSVNFFVMGGFLGGGVTLLGLLGADQWSPGGMSPYILGYHNDIHMAVWARPMTWWAPRAWSHAWVALCLGAALWLLFLAGILWAMVPLGLWVLGQAVLALLTRWDQQWDDVFLAQASRKYREFYDVS